MKISTGTRVHVALADLGGATMRAFGGLGVAVNYPRTVIEVEQSTSIGFCGFETLDETAFNDVKALVTRIGYYAPEMKLKLRMLKHPPQHAGFGSKTALMLSVASLINKFLHLELTQQQLQGLTGRGGASGVGVHTFFTGGIIVDAGHKHLPGTLLLPSGAGISTAIPPVILRTTFPSSWGIVLFLPRDGRKCGGVQEVAFFKEHTPIPTIEALQTLGLIYHGLVPSLMEEDFPYFKKALKEINRVGFKRREIVAQTAAISNLITTLNAHPAIAAGMSSLGPLIFGVLGDRSAETIEYISTIASEESTGFLGHVEPENEGYSCA